jgi:hypothetical protein
MQIHYRTKILNDWNFQNQSLGLNIKNLEQDTKEARWCNRMKKSCLKLSKNEKRQSVFQNRKLISTKPGIYNLYEFDPNQNEIKKDLLSTIPCFDPGIK